MDKDDKRKIELTQEEINVVLKVAEKCKCTFGILRLFVHNLRRIVNPLIGKMNQNSIELAQEEIDVILNVAIKCACDVDGDILNLFVKTDERIVKPITLLPML